MITHDLPQLAGHTIRAAKLRLANPDSAEPDELELEFTDGITYTVEVSPTRSNVSTYSMKTGADVPQNRTLRPRHNGEHGENQG